jgi:hypothetical protein
MKPILKSRQVKICSIQNGLKQRNALALLYKFLLEHIIRNPVKIRSN